jgi:hypothetical protein
MPTGAPIALLARACRRSSNVPALLPFDGSSTRTRASRCAAHHRNGREALAVRMELIAEVPLLPFRGSRSVVGSNRAPADDWSSSLAAICIRPSETLASRAKRTTPSEGRPRLSRSAHAENRWCSRFRCGSRHQERPCNWDLLVFSSFRGGARASISAKAPQSAASTQAGTQWPADRSDRGPVSPDRARSSSGPGGRGR